MPVSVDAIRFRGEINKARSRQRYVECFKIRVPSEIYFGPIVETGATHRAIVHTKSRDADDVQGNVRRRTQSRDVAGVWRNLRFDERNAEHFVRCHLSLVRCPWSVVRCPLSFVRHN